MERETADQHQIEKLRNNEGDNRDLDRCADVLPRIETRCEHSHQNQPEQANTVGNQRVSCHENIVSAEGAVVEEGRDQRNRQDRQRQGGRCRQQQSQA